MVCKTFLKSFIPSFQGIDPDKLASDRVRASDRHCRQMRRNNKIGTKILIWRQLLAKKIAGENFCLALECHLPLKVIDSCCLTVINVYISYQLTPRLSTTQFSS